MALSFQVQCQKFAEKIDLNLSTVIRRSAAQLYSDIVKCWPVDTGYSRRNWQVSADTPATGLIGVEPKKKKGQPTVEVEPLYQPAGTDTQIPSMPKDVMRIWLVNNVVYAEALENGHSKQAPYGCVRIAVAQLETEWEKIVGKIE
jgi:hypothetical protein